MVNQFSSLMTLDVVYEEICCLLRSVDCIYDHGRKDIFATCSDIISSSTTLRFMFVYPYSVIYIIINCLLFMCITFSYVQVAHKVYVSGKVQKSQQKVKQVAGNFLQTF